MVGLGWFGVFGLALLMGQSKWLGVWRLSYVQQQLGKAPLRPEIRNAKLGMEYDCTARVLRSVRQLRR